MTLLIAVDQLYATKEIGWVKRIAALEAELARVSYEFQHATSLLRWASDHNTSSGDTSLHDSQVVLRSVHGVTERLCEQLTELQRERRKALALLGIFLEICFSDSPCC